MKKQKKHPHVVSAQGAFGGAGPHGLVAKLHEAAHDQKAPANPLKPQRQGEYRGAGTLTRQLDVILVRAGVSPAGVTERDVRRLTVSAGSDLDARTAPAVLALTNKLQWVVHQVVPVGTPVPIESEARARARELEPYKPGARLAHWQIPSL